MPVNGNKLALTRKNIENAPDEPGVYALYVGGHMIYYGSAENSIQSSLLAHMSGGEGDCTAVANVYSCELALNPVSRQKELLKEYKRAYGVLPHCNSKLP